MGNNKTSVESFRTVSRKPLLRTCRGTEEEFSGDGERCCLKSVHDMTRVHNYIKSDSSFTCVTNETITSQHHTRIAAHCTPQNKTEYTRRAIFLRVSASLSVTTRTYKILVCVRGVDTRVEISLTYIQMRVSTRISGDCCAHIKYTNHTLKS
ncbi:hypothetical protein QTP88_009251 [Uroleucon formosanum]